MVKKNISKEGILKTLREIAEKRFAEKKAAKKKKIAKKKEAKKKKELKKKAHKIKKSSANPIISPNSENSWEAWQTFNPAAVLVDGKVHLLYRAIGHDAISRLGYAVSEDGFNINERFPDPVYEHRTGQEGKYVVYSIASGGSWGGCEDARIMEVEGDDNLYLTYTACDGGLRVGFSVISKEDFVNKKWKWSKAKLISPPGEIHKNWALFPEKINGKYAMLTGIVPKIEVFYLDDLKFKDIKHLPSKRPFGMQKNKESKKTWDAWLRGPGPPPIKTKYGWLLFYHAMDKNDWSKYKLGAMILDLDDPTKILYRSREPILVPEECYEMEGAKGGVVYALGAVVKEDDLLIYYGSADNHVCVAHVNFDKFLKALTKKTIKLPKLKFLNFGKLLRD